MHASDECHALGAHFECLHVLFCFVSSDCLRVTTGKTYWADGTLQVIVNGVIVSDKNPNKFYDNGEVVVDKCFQSVDKVQVRNPTTNAWAGSIVASRGGSDSYQPFLRCIDCVRGNASAEEAIVVDGNSDSTEFGKTACHNGATCELHFLPGWHQHANIFHCFHAHVCSLALT